MESNILTFSRKLSILGKCFWKWFFVVFLNMSCLLFSFFSTSCKYFFVFGIKEAQKFLFPENLVFWMLFFYIIWQPKRVIPLLLFLLKTLLIHQIQITTTISAQIIFHSFQYSISLNCVGHMLCKPSYNSTTEFY